MIMWSVLGGIAATIAVIDARTQKIPYRLSIPMFALAAWQGSPVSGLTVLAATMGVSLLMRGLKRPAFGDGDAMLIGAAGCLVDWRWAVLGGALPAVAAWLTNYPWEDAKTISLGPWIIAGEAAMIALVKLI